MLQKRIVNSMSRTYKTILLITLILMAILPIIVNTAIKGYDSETAEIILQQNCCFFYPACIIYLIVILLYPAIQEEGKELLYVYQRMYYFEALLPFCILFIFLLLSSIFFWHNIIANPFQFIIKNGILLLSFVNICYGLLYTFKSLTIMIILSVFFFLLSMINPMGLLDVMPYEIQTNTELLYSMKEYIIISIICFVLGIISNKKYCHYAI